MIFSFFKILLCCARYLNLYFVVLLYFIILFLFLKELFKGIFWFAIFLFLLGLILRDFFLCCLIFFFLFSVVQFFTFFFFCKYIVSCYYYFFVKIIILYLYLCSFIFIFLKSDNARYIYVLHLLFYGWWLPVVYVVSSLLVSVWGKRGGVTFDGSGNFLVVEECLTWRLNMC